MHGEPMIILLVEDNEDHAELVIRNLRKHQIANMIFHVSDGEQALDYLFHRGMYEAEGSSPTPSLILLDLRIPKVDGLTILKIIKSSEDLRMIPTVVLTSSQADADLYSAYKNYVNSFLVKPLDAQKFQILMRDLGMYWLGWNTQPYPDIEGRGGD